MAEADIVEVVYVFDDGSPVVELRYRDFEQLAERGRPLPGAPRSAGVYRAAYVEVAAEAGERTRASLHVAGVVFFLLPLDERGRCERNFSVPLAYLLRNAGPGPDFGRGRVPMACRGQCPVPWHANDLWDPAERSTTDPATVLAGAVAANALGLTPAPRPRKEAIACPTLRSVHRDSTSTPAHRAQRSQPRAEPPSLPAEAAIERAVANQRREDALRVEQLSAEHASALLAVQARHDKELAALRAQFEGETQLYKQEIVRLKTQVGRLLATSADASRRLA